MRRQPRTVVICEISCLNVSTQPRDEEQGDAHLDIRNNILYTAQATVSVRLRDEKKRRDGVRRVLLQVGGIAP